MHLLDKIVLNEIPHNVAYQFYIAFKGTFKTVSEVDLCLYVEYNLITIQVGKKDEKTIMPTRLGNLLYKRITGFITQKQYEFCNERISFCEPFFE